MSKRKSDELTDRMHAALVQIGETGSYEGFVPSCKALARRGLVKWVHGRETFEGYVLTDAGRRLYEEHEAAMAGALERSVAKRKAAARKAELTFEPTDADRELGEQWAEAHRGPLDEDPDECVYTGEDLAEAFAHGFAGGKKCALDAAKILAFKDRAKGPEQ